MNELTASAGHLPAALSTDSGERLAALFDDHHDRLYRLARRLAADRDVALDLVQEAYLKAARSISKAPIGSAREEAWLVRILVNAQRDRWRKERVRRRYEANAASAGDSQDPERALAARTTVWRALDALP